MTFSEILKTAILQVISSMRFSDIYVGEVVSQYPTKIKIDDKLFLQDEHIIKSQKFSTSFTLGKKVIFIRETGGQKYFAIDYVYEDKEEFL